MIYHIFINYNFYNLKFRDFVLENYSNQKHIFVFRQKPSNKYIFKTGNNKYAWNFLKLFGLIPQLVKSEKIFIHYLPNGLSIIFWTLMTLFHKKIIWVFWGGDIYLYLNSSKKVSDIIIKICRSIIIRRIRYIAGFLPGDFALIQKWYNTNALFIPIIYPLPITIDNQAINKFAKIKPLQILLGNSADPSNNHFEALSILEKFKNENIKIICPLSYGGDKEYINKIIESGTNIFKDKFIALTQFLVKDEYQNLLNETNIALMCHNRQQGLGNILPLLNSGCKVYIKPEITTYNYFQNMGVRLFNIYDIVKMDYNSFVNFENEWGVNNNKIIKEHFSKNTFVYLWTNAFNL